MIRTKGTTPKFQVFNNALMTANSNLTFEQARRDSTYWGRLVESCCGSHIVRLQQSFDYKTYYWRQKNDEMDYVIQSGNTLSAIEIKSGSSLSNSGMGAFKKRFADSKTYVVSYQEVAGSLAIPMETFLHTEPVLL